MPVARQLALLLVLHPGDRRVLKQLRVAKKRKTVIEL
jgi:hypothetical protein